MQMKTQEDTKFKQTIFYIRNSTQCKWLCKSLGSILSILPISGIYSVKCVSKDHAEGHCIFKLSIIKIVYACLLCVIITTGSAYFCHEISTNKVANSRGSGLFLHAVAVTIVERLSCYAKLIEGSVTIAASVWHSKKFAECLTKLSFIDVQLSINSKHHRQTYLASCCTLPMFFCIFAFFFTCTNYIDNDSWPNNDVPVSVYISFVLFSLMKIVPYVFCALFTLVCNIYIERFRRIKDMVQEIISEEESLDKKRKICLQYGPQKTSSLTGKLDYVQCLYSTLSQSVVSINTCFNPQLLVCFVGQLYATVRNVFLTVQDTTLGRTCSTGCSIGFNVVYTLSHLFSILSLVISGEVLSKTAQSVTTGLEAWPTCGLSQEEKIQIQMFLTRIRDTPVYLTASSVFIVGAGLLAPIAGNVMTYFLVVLQLESSDQQNYCCNSTRPV